MTRVSSGAVGDGRAVPGDGEALPRPAPTAPVLGSPRPVAGTGRQVCRLNVMIDHKFDLVKYVPAGHPTWMRTSEVGELAARVPLARAAGWANTRG